MSKTSDMEPREPLAVVPLKQWKYSQAPTSDWNKRNRPNQSKGDNLNVSGDILSDMELTSMLTLLRTVSSITLTLPIRSSNLKRWKKRWLVIAQRSGSKQQMPSMPHSCRMRPGTLWSCQVEDKPLEASGSSRSSVEVMERWNGSKLGWLPKATLRSMGSITTKLSPQL